MKLEDFKMLKNIEVYKYFDLIRHVMELDKTLWKRHIILNNLKEGFKMIKCTSTKTCDKPAVALTEIAILILFLLLKIIRN